MKKINGRKIVKSNVPVLSMLYNAKIKNSKKKGRKSPRNSLLFAKTAIHPESLWRSISFLLDTITYGKLTYI